MILKPLGKEAVKWALLLLMLYAYSAFYVKHLKRAELASRKRRRSQGDVWK